MLITEGIPTLLESHVSGLSFTTEERQSFRNRVNATFELPKTYWKPLYGLSIDILIIPPILHAITKNHLEPPTHYPTVAFTHV